MNPNAIVLTPDVYEKLKADIKRELDEERRRVPVYSSSWEELKRSVEKNYRNPEAYQIINGVSAILRNTLNLPNIKYLNGEVGEKAIQITIEYIDAVRALKGDTK